jgi:UDP-N-acetylglucosamine 2-epimerase (non-hydrolysing)
VIDALQAVVKRPAPSQAIALLHKLGVPEDMAPGDRQPGLPRLVMVTAHRRENFGEPFEQICGALKTLSEMHGEAIRILWPVHLNPNVQEPVYRLLGNIPNIILTPPLDYLPMMHMLKRSALLLTDSGGLQEEAPGLGVPVLVLRRVTERPEGVQAGTVRLVGTDKDIILSEARRLLDDPLAHAAMAQAVNPYGDGHAAERIVAALLKEDEYRADQIGSI